MWHSFGISYPNIWCTWHGMSNAISHLAVIMYMWGAYGSHLAYHTQTYGAHDMVCHMHHAIHMLSCTCEGHVAFIHHVMPQHVVHMTYHVTIQQANHMSPYGVLYYVLWEYLGSFKYIQSPGSKLVQNGWWIAILNCWDTQLSWQFINCVELTLYMVLVLFYLAYHINPVTRTLCKLIKQ